MLENLDKKLLEEIYDLANKHIPLEICGVLVNIKGKIRFKSISNISIYPELEFVLCPREYVDIEDKYDIIAIVHSHVNNSCEPSQADIVSCEKNNRPWLIVSVPNNSYKIIKPTGYKAPLLNRKFSHGVLDCYTLIKDYYKLELDIDLPDFEREHFWWKKGQDIYMENFSKAGFSIVEELNVHDVILIQLESDKVNHGAIYIGDTRILHHPMNRLSHRDIYGGYWRKNTRCYLRHERLM